MENNKRIEYYNKEYMPSIIKIGMITNLLGVLLMFLPVLVLTFIFDLHPPVSAIIAGFIMQFSVSGVFWFVEPISYFPVLGVAGTYMSFLSGNIGNLRLPATVTAQQAAKVEPGTEDGSVVATVGVAVSIIVNVVMLTIGVILGSSVLSILPTGVVTALNNLLPALFGAMLAQQAVANPKLGVIGVVLAGIMFFFYRNGMLAWLPGTPSYAIIIVAVFGTILIGRKVAVPTAKSKTGEKNE